MIHSILCVQFTCLTILFDNLFPGPLWSSSWSWTLNFKFHAFLHPVIVFFSQQMPIPMQTVLQQYQCYVIYTYNGGKYTTAANIHTDRSKKKQCFLQWWQIHLQTCRQRNSAFYNGGKYTPRVNKKQDTKLLPITSPNGNQFSQFFHWHTHW